MTLDDDLILWQIDLLRHDAWLRKELRAKLTKTQQEALAVLLQSANLSVTLSSKATTPPANG